MIAVGRGGTAVATWIDDTNVNQPTVSAAVRPGAAGSFGAGGAIAPAGNGLLTVSGLRAAVGDGGQVAVIWSRTNLVPQTLVEVNSQAAGGTMNPGTSQNVSNSLSGTAIEPAIAVGADARMTALWGNSGVVKFAEDPPGPLGWSGEDQASPAGASAQSPSAEAGPNGLVVAAWQADSRVQAAARSNGGAFGGYTNLSGPSMAALLPQVAVGAGGDALIAWLTGDGKQLATVRRTAGGALWAAAERVHRADQSVQCLPDLDRRRRSGQRRRGMDAR